MISIIICCNNQEQYDEFCYPALYRTDQLLQMMGQEPLDIQLIYDPETIFKGNNQGIANAKYPIKVFMHQDVNLLQTTWLFKLVKAFAENPDYGLIGFCGTKKLPDRGFWWEAGREHVVGELFSGSEKANWAFNSVTELTEVECVDSYFMATNRDVLFDESLPGFHLVDMDYSRTFTALGYKLGVIPHKAWHIGTIRSQDTSKYLEAHYEKWGSKIDAAR
jgi:GT2 family glycosyltransferase